MLGIQNGEFLNVYKLEYANQKTFSQSPLFFQDFVRRSSIFLNIFLIMLYISLVHPRF